MGKIDLIAIGTSTGGPEALSKILPIFKHDLPGIVIVQHMPAAFTKIFSERLNGICELSVKEAEDGDLVKPNSIYIAPGSFQMRVKKISDFYRIECFKGEKVNGHCPSVDVLFNSVADEAKSGAVGVIMTGMGADGSKGLLKMKKNGCRTFGEDEKSCIVYGMPKVAYNIGAVDEQAALEEIPYKVMDFVKKQNES